MLIGRTSTWPDLALHGLLRRLIHLLAHCHVIAGLIRPVCNIVHLLRMLSVHEIVTQRLGAKSRTVPWHTTGATDNIRLRNLSCREVATHDRSWLPHVILRLNLWLFVIDIDKAIRSCRSPVIRVSDLTYVTDCACRVGQGTPWSVSSKSTLSSGELALGCVRVPRHSRGRLLMAIILSVQITFSICAL